MPSFTAADTIRILVSTDNHVGYNERDAIRGDDSWRSFDEVMCLAKERDVDMVLLAGDLFHENKPSRKSMYQVMRSLRMNCLGDKPCELEMLGDGSEHFTGAFNHVNYEDANINVAIPVFSIHGNHDDPSGEGLFAALDILQASGLLNYYGRTPESDKINVKPVCLQKGKTKLALYGLSNVRDERLFRTFRDGHVKFFRPDQQTGDWFNLMSVHQNHHAYTETGYLPETFLPGFMDLIVWGHEHECKIDPITNAEQGFKVMQPGSSVATSLVEGEAVPKQIAIVSITGTDFKCENIRLKTVRPFVWRDIILKDQPGMVKISQMSENRVKISQYLEGIVNELIEEAKAEWREAQQEHGSEGDEEDCPLPIVRLRVENTPPEGGRFEVENPQRFSSRFVDRVANTTDVVQYHRKRATTKTVKGVPDMPEESVMDQMLTLDSVKVERLVKEFLTAQSLTILPQNSFNDAVGQFVDKDDRHAMEEFLKYSLEQQRDSLLGTNEDDDSDSDGQDDARIAQRIEDIRVRLEEAHSKGERKRAKKSGKRNPKPANWDSDFEGHWEDSMMSIPVYDEDGAGGEEDIADDASVASTTRKTPAARGRGSRGGRGGKTTAGTTRAKAATAKAAPAKAAAGRGKKRQPFDDEDDEDEEEEDVIMIDDDDDDDDEESQGLFVSERSTKAPTSRSTRARAEPAKSAAKPAAKAAAKPAAKTTRAAAKPNARQTQIAFGTQTTAGRSSGRAATSSRPAHEPSEDEISDDDAFEPPPPTQRATRRR